MDYVGILKCDAARSSAAIYGSDRPISSPTMQFTNDVCIENCGARECTHPATTDLSNSLLTADSTVTAVLDSEIHNGSTRLQSSILLLNGKLAVLGIGQNQPVRTPVTKHDPNDLYSRTPRYKYHPAKTALCASMSGCLFLILVVARARLIQQPGLLLSLFPERLALIRK